MIPRRRVRLSAFGLARLAAVVIGAFVALAAVLRVAAPPDPLEAARVRFIEGDVRGAEEVLVAHLRARPDDVEGWHMLVEQRGFAVALRAGAEALPAKDVATLDPERVTPALDDAAFTELLRTARGISQRALEARLAFGRTLVVDDALAIVLDDPPALDDLMEAGALALEAGDAPTAFALFEVAARAGETRARVRVLESLARSGADDLFLARMAAPEWRAVAPRGLVIHAALLTDDYPVAVREVLIESVEHLAAPVIVACVVAGLAWIFFLLVSAQCWEWRRREQVALVLALVLGMFSAMVTLAFAVVMDDVIDHAARAASDAYLFVYFVMGVGFREELLKLLCIAPVLYLVRHARHEGELLVVASLGGLGFAVVENTGYFAGAEVSPVVIGRFLTANFLHLALTGYVGLALGRAFKKGGASWETFTFDFVKVVLAHGLYDFLLSATFTDGLSYFAMTVFVWIAHAYLSVLVPLFPLQSRVVALSTTFTIALAVAVGVNFALVSFTAGLGLALELTFLGALGNVVIAFVFYRTLHEEIV